MDEQNTVDTGSNESVSNSETQDNANVSSEQTSSGSETQAVDSQSQKSVPKKKSVLSGNGDIQNPENYIEGLNIPEDQKQILRDRIKYGLSTRQAVAEKTIAKVKADQKKYGFNDINDLKTMIASNPDIQKQLIALQEQEQFVEQSTQEQNVNIELASKNWSSFDENQKRQLFEAMTPDQRVLLKNAITLEETKRAESKMQFDKLHSENEKKHGESYKKALPEMMNHFSNNYFKNATEYVYKAMNYENYGKQMYEKGLRERNNSAGISSTHSSSDKQATKFNSAEEALRASLAAKGLSYKTLFG